MPVHSLAPLYARTIAVPETREIESLATMLEEQGATVLRCPMVAILDAPDAAPIEIWLRRLAANEFHDLILTTGEGLRRLMGFARRAAMEDPLREALGRVRKFTRGPKPARALTELGLSPDVACTPPTTTGIIEALKKVNLTGRVVGVQLYGSDPNTPLVEYLASAGAIAVTVAPYVYAPAVHDERVCELIRAMQAGRISAIAFTSAVQVRRLCEVAHSHHLEAALKGLSKTVIAAVGPVVADELKNIGHPAAIVPKGSFFIRPLVKEIVELLSQDTSNR